MAAEQRRYQEEIKRQEEEKRKREEEERKKREEETKKRLKRYVKSGNDLIDMANSLAQHRQSCPVRLLPAANELDKLIAEYVVAIVGTTASAVGGAVATGALIAFAPFTFGITGAIAVGTGAAAVAIAAGGGVGAEKVRDKIKSTTVAHSRAQDWIARDKELCSNLLRGVVAYEESWNGMTEMLDDETIMHAYLKREGVTQLSKVQKRFTQMSAKVVQKWRDQKFDPDNEAEMRHGRK